jgi:hypothetical protein
MQVMTGGIFALAVLTIFLIARMRGLSAWLAVAAAAAFGSSGIVLGLTDKILSDGTYLFFAGIALAMMLLFEQRRWDETHPFLAAAIVVAPLVLAYGARVIGLSLAAAFVLYALVQRRFRLFHYLVAFGFGAAVLIYSATLYDTKSYRSGFEPHLRVYFQNAFFYAHAPADLWAGIPTGYRYLLLAVTGLIAAAEWLRRLAFNRSIVEFYTFTTIVAILLYLSGGTSRYMLPVLAFYFVYFLLGVEYWRTRLKLGWWVPAAACVLLGIGGGLNVRAMAKGPYAQGVEQATFRPLCEYVTHNVNRDALIVSWNPRVVALYTDRRSAWYPEAASDQELADYLERVGAEYSLVYNGRPHMERAIDFAPVFRNDDFVLYAKKRTITESPQ